MSDPLAGIEPDADWTALPLDAGIRVEVGRDTPQLSGALDAAVTACWEDARRESPALFNGRVFSADRIGPQTIVGHWTEYCRVLAQIRRPELGTQLSLKPLAVNGLLECADGVVLGRRRAKAVYKPGCWQAAPAGNVEARFGDEIDLREQLEAELWEELGLDPAELIEARPVVAVEHPVTHIVDIGFMLRTDCSFANIASRHGTHGNDEYDELRVVAADEVEDFLDRAGGPILPSARILMALWLAAPERAAAPVSGGEQVRDRLAEGG